MKPADKTSTKIAEYFAGYRLRQCHRGQVLIFQGDTVEYAFYLTQGTVKQYSVTKKGGEIVLNMFKPGAFFPMSNVINGIPSNHLFEVETDAEMRVIPKDDIIRFLKENPDVLYDLLSRVYRGVEGLLGRLEHLMGSGAGNRFIYELLTEAKRFGEQTANGEITVSINENSIAQRAGLSRETVSRQMRKLKAKDLIRTKRNSITIPNIANLEKMLD